MASVLAVWAADTLGATELVVLVAAVLAVSDSDTIVEAKLVVSVVVVDLKALVVTDIVGSLDPRKTKPLRKIGRTYNHRFLGNVRP